MQLPDLEKGQKAKIIKISGETQFKRRLRDMGLTKNEEIQVENIAPLGDPIEIIIRGYRLSLRKNEAKNIEVEESREKEEKK